MSTKTWKDIRINEINESGATYAPSDEYFKEVYAIEQFKMEFEKNNG